LTLGIDFRVGGLDYVVLVVEDLDRSVEFYCCVLGLPLSHRAPSYAQLATGDTRLGLFTRSEMALTLGRELVAPDVSRPGFELGFKVESADEAFAHLVAAGAKPVCAPADRPWGQRTAYVGDPDGHLIELAEDQPGRRPGSGS
jgi:catechol 2,3-dioxygenase-like lactoylglutathione lyase family enzyme